MAIDNKDKKILNVPPLRFPEFSGEWKCTTIGNIGDIKNGPFGSVLHAEDYVENGIPIVTTEHFKTGLMPSDKFGIPQVSNEDYIRLKGYRLETNDIVFSRVGSVDINAHVGIEQNGWLFSGRVLRVRPKYDIDSLFLHYALSTEAVKRDIRNRAVGQTMPSINTPILSSTTIQLPKDLFEQKKVAHFLRLLDERIITQHKIIEDLKKLKSAIVEMLLCNQNGESFKLRDVGCFVRGLTYANEDVTENKAATTVIRANNLNYGNNVDKDEVVYVNKTPTTSQILRKGDIVICMANGSSSLVGKNSYYPFNDGQSTIGAFCGIYRTSYPFVKWLMQSQRYKRLVYQSLQGGNGAIANLNGDDILNMSFPLIENGKSQSIIFAIDAIEKSLMVNKSLQRLYYTQKSYLLKQMFI